jgi:hypothetical protein
MKIKFCLFENASIAAAMVAQRNFVDTAAMETSGCELSNQKCLFV